MSNESDPPSALPDDLRMLYDNATGNIEFAKRQQWWLTAQTLLLHTGIFALFLTFDRHHYWEFITFEIVIFLITGGSAYFIWDYYSWRVAEDKRIDWIREHHLGPEFNKAWEQKAEYRSQQFPEKQLGNWSSCIEPTCLLLLTVVVGGIAIFYHIWKVYYAQGQPPLCWT